MGYHGMNKTTMHWPLGLTFERKEEEGLVTMGLVHAWLFEQTATIRFEEPNKLRGELG